MKPFLLLQSRPEDATSDNEYDGFLTSANLKPERLKRIRVEAAPLSYIDLDDYCGVIVGGGPFNVSDPEDKKTDMQKRTEADFARILNEIYEKDFPFFGACYGIGILGKLLGGKISRKYQETLAPIPITLTEEGEEDALLQGVPRTFYAMAGHKEACEVLPPGAVNLASSPLCPVQMFRVKKNMYVTQFHPELDLLGLRIRIAAYKNSGYFAPEDAEKIIGEAAAANLSYAPIPLKNFVKIYSA